MRLYWKHWCKSVKRSPIQPIFILLTVVLAVALSVTAFRMQFLLEEISERFTSSETDLGDVILSVRGDSSVRFLFSEDVEEALSEDLSHQILGEYSFTALYEISDGTDLLSVGGVDLEAADRYFAFRYLEYGSFTTQNEKNAAILSRSTAAKYGLCVGDPIDLQIGDRTVGYTVQAIAEADGLLKERDALVSVSGILNLFSENNLFLSVMGTQSLPYNRIFLRFAEAGNAETAVIRLAAAPALADKQVSLAASDAREDFLIFMQRSAVFLISAVLLLLCGLLLATCLQLLQTQRSYEFAFFYSIGASKRQLAGLQLAESGMYALLGGIGGVCLAHPLLKAAWNVFEMPERNTYVEIAGWIFGIGFSMLLMQGCTFLSLRSQKNITVAEWVRKEESRTKPCEAKPLFLPFALLTAGSLVLMAVIPVSVRYLPGLCAVVFFVLFLYTVLPMRLRNYASAAERSSARRYRKHADFLLAAKNIRQQFPLRHVGRLLTVLIAVLTVVAVCSQVLRKQTDLFEHAFEGDLIAVNVPQETEERIAALSSVAGAARFDIVTSAEISDRYTVMAVVASGTLDSVLYRDFIPDQMPSRSEIVISKGLSALAGIGIGDAVSVTLEGKQYSFTVSEIQNVHSNFIFLNGEAVFGTRDLLGISLTEEARSDPRLQAELFALLDADGIVTMDPGGLTASTRLLLNGFSKLLQAATGIAVAVSLMGCVNLLTGHWRARKRERFLLTMCGMTKYGLLRMYVAESILLCVPILTIGLLAGAALCLILHFGMYSFGIVLFTF